MLPLFKGRVLDVGCGCKPCDPDQHQCSMEIGEEFGFSAAEMSQLLSLAEFALAEKRRFMLGINAVYVGKIAACGQ